MVSGVGRGEICLFKRNKNGKLDENGTYRELDTTKLNCKYDKEICLLLGVAAVKYLDGRVEGKRARLFSYTEKTIVTQKDYEKRVQEQI